MASAYWVASLVQQAPFAERCEAGGWYLHRIISCCTGSRCSVVVAVVLVMVGGCQRGLGIPAGWLWTGQARQVGWRRQRVLLGCCGRGTMGEKRAPF